MRKYISLTTFLLLGACASQPATGPAPALLTASPLAPPASAATDGRINGQVTGGALPPRPSASYGATLAPPGAAQASASGGNGDITFDFADTDIRAVVAQVLGGILHVNYTIDPSVSGTVTLRTVTPLTQDQVLPTLQTMLAQNNAVLVQSSGLYRVMPADQSGGAALASNPALGGAEVLPLRYASAQPLATMLQPYVTKGGSITADPTRNALIIQGDPATREALTGLIQAFDVDALAGQSYELFPVTGGDAKDFADAFSAALTKTGDTAAKGPAAVSVVPLERISAVLVIARSQSYLADAARVYGVLAQVQTETVRSWHVYYLRNSRANDAAYLLQQAFTPDAVTAQPSASATVSQNAQSGGMNGSSSNMNNSGASSEISSSTGSTDASSANSSNGTGTSSAASATQSSASTSGASALLGPLSSTGNASGDTQSGIRIIPDVPNNSLLVYATTNEDAQIEGVLSKIDIMPLEVRIDATIAEVELTGELKYGTQYYFKSGDINTVLTTASTAALDSTFPGFVLAGTGNNAFAISALQSVTKVRVLSSPELMVLDGQGASLQVGNSVPYLSQTSQSTTSNSAVIDSIDYRDTGVILHVTPHVGSNGLVTMDISQEVSGVSPTVTTTGLNSPTFTERAVTSRVAIQDGQTVGLAGLISDDDSRQNSGIPGLKNLPWIGAAFGSQTNNRTRQELLVLITPHVIRTQQQALDLTEDMQQALPQAAAVPGALRNTPTDNSDDPNLRLENRLIR
ncbi:type II secretion system secretin GspD [Acidocella aromatica]|uniref:General secretion pathway protein D n=1 Tax=Acidocella aromatica TaxID=1303579 RepID=A0A840V8Z6_9PROT|nr:type II secretion system secretin GspD [Acidocella aromatica]MBB5372216.1 general secretion pathway protein D [Acidocella aromatica]